MRPAMTRLLVALAGCPAAVSNAAVWSPAVVVGDTRDEGAEAWPASGSEGPPPAPSPSATSGALPGASGAIQGHSPADGGSIGGAPGASGSSFFLEADQPSNECSAEDAPSRSKAAANQAREETRCEDAGAHCRTWAVAGLCESKAHLMEQKCPVTCGFCGLVRETSKRVPTSAPRASCQDRHKGCLEWAVAGECMKNVNLMRRMCPFSCRFCRTLQSSAQQRPFAPVGQVVQGSKLPAPAIGTKDLAPGEEPELTWSPDADPVLLPESMRREVAENRVSQVPSPIRDSMQSRLEARMREQAQESQMASARRKQHRSRRVAAAKAALAEKQAKAAEQKKAATTATPDENAATPTKPASGRVRPSTPEEDPASRTKHVQPAVVPGASRACDIPGDLCEECANLRSNAQRDCPLSCKACVRSASDPLEAGVMRIWSWHEEALARPSPAPGRVLSGLESQLAAFGLLASRSRQASSAQQPRAGGALAQPPWSAHAEKVRAAFLHAWRGYCGSAWGADELRPDTRRGRNSFGGVGMSILDSLSTLWLLNLPEEFERAAAFVEDQLEFGKENQMLSVFELTIRALGGLLGAYALSGRPLFLRRARDLAARLLPAFNTESRFPVQHWNLRSNTGGSGKESTMLAEVGSIQLEWRYLANATGHRAFDRVVSEAFVTIQQAAARPLPVQAKALPPRPPGLLPVLLTPPRHAPPRLIRSPVAVGGRADSYYEYLLKQWLQDSYAGNEARQLFCEFMVGLPALLRPVPVPHHPPGQVYRVIQLEGAAGRAVWKMEHLTCFVPGLIALALLTLPEEDVAYHRGQWLRLAEGIMAACIEMWTWTSSGLAPEHVVIDQRPPHKIKSVPEDGKHSFLRPETVESLYYMYRLTREERYREAGARIFDAINLHARAAVGFSSVGDVRRAQGLRRTDDMQSFVLAETLKYLYLLFAPEGLVDLEEYVFNTEGHPLRRLRAPVPHKGPSVLSDRVTAVRKQRH